MIQRDIESDSNAQTSKCAEGHLNITTQKGGALQLLEFIDRELNP